MAACCASSNKKRIEILLKENVDLLLKFRLSEEEKIYHIKTFFDFAEKNVVEKKNFPKLLGFFGTDIASQFALRIFEIFSADKQCITLGEYLRYIDIYQHGENGERCLITFKLMDFNNNNSINFKEFMDYIKLMIVAIKKVHPSTDDSILSEKEMKILFKSISNNKDHFNFEDFRLIYEQKPLLLSWIDYFKKDEAEMIPDMDESIKELLSLQFKFFKQFGKIVEETISLNGNKFNFTSAINKIEEFCNIFEKHNLKIEKYSSRINIRNIIDKFKTPKFHHTADFKMKKFLSRNTLEIEENEKYEQSNLMKTEEFTNKKSINEKFVKSSKMTLPKIIEVVEDGRDISPNIIDEKINNHLGIIRNTLSSINISPRKDNISVDFNNLDSNNISKNSISLEEICIEKSLDPKILMDINNNIKKKAIKLDESTNEKSQDQRVSILSNSLSKTNKSSDYLAQKNLIENKINNNKLLNDITMNHTYSSEIEKYNSKIKIFLSKLRSICDINVQSLIIIIKIYSVISRKYISKSNKRDSRQFTEDIRISKTNIPKKLSKPTIMNKKSKNNLLNPGDSNFKILLTMIMGVQKTVQSTPNLEIDSKDLSCYIRSMKYSLGEAFLNSQEHYYIKDYGGIIFNSIRKLYDIDIISYVQSISPQDIITEIMISYTSNIEQLCSTGSSGSLFYYTTDAKYILKTLPKREFEVLKRILPNYYNYLKDNKFTLLPKFFGCYKLVRRLKNEKKRFYFIIMDNLFSTNKEINYRYDIKGSIIGRRVLNDDNKFDPQKKYDYAFKDLDLEENKHSFNIGDKKKLFIDQLRKDSEFLRDNNIIDYSLLIGTHINENEHRISDVIHEHKNFAQSHGREFNPLASIKVLNKSIPKALNRIRTISLNVMRNIEDQPIISNEMLIEDDKDYDLFSIDESFDSKQDVVINEAQKHIFKDYADGGINNFDKKEIYYIGVIDILTEYSLIKKCEFFGKLLYHCSTKMSCVPADSYQKRFFEYMNKKIVDS